MLLCEGPGFCLEFLLNLLWVVSQEMRKALESCGEPSWPERLPRWVTGSLHIQNTARDKQEKLKRNVLGCSQGTAQVPDLPLTPESLCPMLFLLHRWAPCVFPLQVALSHWEWVKSHTGVSQFVATNPESSENCFLNGFWDVITFLLLEWILQQPNAPCC